MSHREPRRKRALIVGVALAALLTVPAVGYAAHKFTDVPDSNVFHDDIAWLADAEVTKGCNPPANTEFCPSDNVTREQMAAFMRRFASYLDAEDGTPAEADNATTVGGLTPDEIAQGFGDTVTAGAVATLDFQQNVELEQIKIDAPSDGYALVIGSASVLANVDSTSLFWLQLDNETCNNNVSWTTSIGFAYESTASGARGATTSMQGIVALSEGSHTLTLCGREYVSGNDPGVYGPSVEAVYLNSASTEMGLFSTGATEALPGMSDG